MQRVPADVSLSFPEINGAGFMTAGGWALVGDCAIDD